MRKPKVLKYKVGEIVKKKYCGVWVDYLIVGTQRGRLPYLVRRVGAKPADWSIYESEKCLRGKGDFFEKDYVDVYMLGWEHYGIITKICGQYYHVKLSQDGILANSHEVICLVEQLTHTTERRDYDFTSD
jgi:hypothetical protein